MMKYERKTQRQLAALHNLHKATIVYYRLLYNFNMLLCTKLEHTDDDDEAHAQIHILIERELEKENVMQGNYNRTNPGHIKRLTGDLFYFTLFCAAFFAASELFDKMMQTS